MKQGCVYFVGAGPGDLELITVKGLRLLQEADVIIFDRLVHPFLLKNTKAKLIYCGKQPCKHTLRQEDIQKELLIHAKRGLKVVRLKGGDPSIFGRVGEEAELCARHQVEYEIIPGITSGSAAGIYSGVPLTYRGLSGSVATVTGHTCTKDGKPAVNWKELAGAVDTIVFYMGVKHLRTIATELTKNGMDKKMPVLIVQWGTYGKQRSLEGTLSTIVNQAELVGMENPAVIIVGNVVKLRSKISWFENKPLSGVGILYPTSKQDLIIEGVKSQGADIYPCSFSPRTLKLDRERMIVTRLIEDKHINTILLTDIQDCLEFFEFIDLSGINFEDLKSCRWICQGKETLLYLESHGIKASRVMEEDPIIEACIPFKVKEIRHT
ncbi:uroporphyrinogen-III C-methyltransferase [Alkalicoccobacillus porphyridii]|uniref:uroporphyrinogen-III C-methyltransferase n=1 Tax=Alkalicoccobacillus porphyridii TaxID=2597270 RepID=UPI00163DE33E|nr:uroporphyrinogen-III C-methyltransferase [Alkalicoccobacillus porphyridii]